MDLHSLLSHDGQSELDGKGKKMGIYLEVGEERRRGGERER